MANPNPRPPKANLGKVLAYQEIQRKLKLYHDSYVEDQRNSLKADILNLAIIHNFVTDFTTVNVAESTRRKRSVDGVTVRKRRSKEKQHKLKQMFAEYREEVERLKAIEKV